MAMNRRPFLKKMVRLPLLGSLVISYMPEALAKAYVHKYPMPPEILDLPNRTKVVRLIVVPSTVDPTDVAAVQAFARSEGAAKTDAFIVRERGTDNWRPMSWRGEALIESEDALRSDRECTVILMNTEREQIQWESNAEFWIQSITKREGVPETRLTNGPAGPDDPFEWLPKGVRGGPGRPIRSGPARVQFPEYRQLYKVTFGMILDGREVMIDPDLIIEP